MKPNNIQVALSKLVEDQAKFWQSTNDINSPTHCCDIEESLYQLSLDYPELTDEVIERLSSSIRNLYFDIASLANKYE